MTGGREMYSLVVPIYRNEDSLPRLLEVLSDLDGQLGDELEVVFVVDGSPDNSFSILRESLPSVDFRSQLIVLSRNFGSFTAIRTGLAKAKGNYFAVMAADLQEPPELVLKFFRELETGETDVTVGVREARDDPFFSKLLSRTFWSLYRRIVQPDMPPGGVDIFGCNTRVRDNLLALNESNTTLVGLLFWLGFRRKEIGYKRRQREHGKSGWSFSKRFNYLVNSVLAFSDLPIWLLMITGALGLILAFLFGLAVLVARFVVDAPIPGYAATMLVIVGFGALNCFGLGVIGAYVWRIFENTKGRPQGVILSEEEFGKG
jgi:glycosyltransferase involved in cell wall biosynthesis